MHAFSGIYYAELEQIYKSLKHRKYAVDSLQTDGPAGNLIVRI